LIDNLQTQWVALLKTGIILLTIQALETGPLTKQQEEKITLLDNQPLLIESMIHLHLLIMEAVHQVLIMEVEAVEALETMDPAVAAVELQATTDLAVELQVTMDLAVELQEIMDLAAGVANQEQIMEAEATLQQDQTWDLLQPVLTMVLAVEATGHLEKQIPTLDKVELAVQVLPLVDLHLHLKEKKDHLLMAVLLD